MTMSLIKREEFCSYPRTVFAWKCMSPNMLISEFISPTYLTFILSEYYKNIERWIIYCFLWLELVNSPGFIYDLLG